MALSSYDCDRKSVLTVHHQMRLGTYLSDGVVRLTDIHPLIILGNIFDHQAAVLFQNLCPPNRDVTILLLPKDLRMWIAPDCALELYPLANQHRNVRRFAHEVGFNWKKKKWWKLKM